jgi:hypothetical protein
MDRRSVERFKRTLQARHRELHLAPAQTQQESRTAQHITASRTCLWHEKQTLLRNLVTESVRPAIPTALPTGLALDSYQVWRVRITFWFPDVKDQTGMSALW